MMTKSTLRTKTRELLLKQPISERQFAITVLGCTPQSLNFFLNNKRGNPPPELLGHLSLKRITRYIKTEE